jgi:hypothetical protein
MLGLSLPGWAPPHAVMRIGMVMGPSWMSGTFMSAAKQQQQTRSDLTHDFIVHARAGLTDALHCGDHFKSLGSSKWASTSLGKS